MKELGWQFQHLLRGIGLPGWVGVALLFACALGWCFAAAPLRDVVEALGASSAASERRLASAANAATALSISPRQQLGEFQRRFIGETGMATSLARLQAAAKRQGVALDKAEFRLASETNEPLLRYTILLPVKADYRALRRFTREALLELPGLAIEEVSLRRGDPKSALLEAQLRFVLFVAKVN